MPRIYFIFKVKKTPSEKHSTAWSPWIFLVVLVALAGGLLPSTAEASFPVFCAGDLRTGGVGIDDAVCTGSLSNPANPPQCRKRGCGGLNQCLPPEVQPPRIDIVPQAGGTFAARVTLDITSRWNDDASANFTTDVFWYESAAIPGPCDPAPDLSICEYTLSDHFETYYEVVGLTCAGAPYSLGPISAQVRNCSQPCGCGAPRLNCICGAASPPDATWANFNNISFEVSREMLGCDPDPPPKVCPKDNSCNDCRNVGPAGASLSGDGSGASPAGSGPGDGLNYGGGGPGNPGIPGSNESASLADGSGSPFGLGRNWMHAWAERIVQDPNENQVWLITRWATFRRFTGLNGGEYTINWPTDEYRTLLRTGTGWELHGLEGTVQTFNAQGLWTQTSDKNGNLTVATYGASFLDSVSLPDGRSLTFTYGDLGRLATIVEQPVSGSSTPPRTWRYFWSGADLIEIRRPDATAWSFVYGDIRHPGFLTQVLLLGPFPNFPNFQRESRVESALEYDAQGNVIKIWKGDTDPTGVDAVEKWEFAFDDPVLPTETTLTDPLGDTSIVQMARDTISPKAKITQLQDSCPSCGGSPNSTFIYGDANHPLLPTEVIDGDGTRTQMSYDSNGQLLSRTEAVGELEERTTTWDYDSNYPAFPTLVEGPTAAGATPTRRVSMTYNPTNGDLENRTQEGVEVTQTGGTFALTTQWSGYNAAGRPADVDPPGFGMADVTSTAYTVPGTNGLIASSRTDPLVGTTTFSYDGLNRRVSVTDPNSVTTNTEYDGLDRVVRTIQEGDGARVADLVTQQSYNAFGDLERTTLPKGNVIEYGYDPAGRLVTIERKPNPSTAAERTLYVLDGFGNRTREELQRWDGSDWVTESFTDFVYATRCYLDTIVHADGSETDYRYDCDGNLEDVWDANANMATDPPSQSYLYDPLDRLVSVTQPWAVGDPAVTRYSYDAQDHLTGVTDAEGNQTTYVYSDRDLLTSEVSPVSGTTTHRYNEHGELDQSTDARGFVTTRTLDPIDRVTQVTYGADAALTTTYTYDDPTVSFSLGRLTEINRPSDTVDYAYDRFGRVTTDGDLTYSYDQNSNRETIGYPGGVTARYTFDFADRESTLTLEKTAAPALPIVTDSTYLPSGPTSFIELANGLTETRDFTQRYFPDRITLVPTGGGAALFDWDYTTDSVGNITRIDNGITPASPRIYDYRPTHYFLTQGDGPWGTLAWTYDKIGNRLTESRDGAAADVYTYQRAAVPATGNSPILDQIQLGIGGTRTYTYGPAGHLSQINAGGNVIDYTFNAEGRLARTERAAASASADFRYDGRSFLTRSDGNFIADSSATSTRGPNQIFADGFEDGDVCNWANFRGATGNNCPQPQNLLAMPTYSSEGLLHALVRDGADDPVAVLYFAGRPVAQVQLDSAGTDTVTYLTTDHLGTPAAISDGAGALLVDGGLEPFGEDFAGMGGAGVFLRFPGQWEDASWREGMLGAGSSYNVHRWYEQRAGRYGRADPLGLRADVALYRYALSNSITFSDPDGLRTLAPTLPNTVWVPPQIPCAMAAFREGKKIGPSQGFRYAHCMSACRIVKDCRGTQELAKHLGFLNEVSQSTQCLVDIVLTGSGEGNPKCDSAAAKQDFSDNEQGFTCPADQTCEERCGDLFGRNKTLDLFGPLSGAKRGDLPGIFGDNK